MQPSHILPTLRRRWPATAGVVVVAIAVAVLLASALGSSPKGTATVQILVDSPESSLVNLKANQTGLESRASVLAQAMSSNAVVSAIARSAGVPVAEVTAQGPYSGPGEVLDVATPSEARGTQVAAQKVLYRLSIVAQTDIPILTVGVEGPSPDAAGALADHVLAGTNSWLASLSGTTGTTSATAIHLRQLGDAKAGSLNSSTPKVIGAVGAVAILLLGLLATLLTDPARRAERARERERAEELLRHALGEDIGFGLASGSGDEAPLVPVGAIPVDNRPALGAGAGAAGQRNTASRKRKAAGSRRRPTPNRS